MDSQTEGGGGGIEEEEEEAWKAEICGAAPPVLACLMAARMSCLIEAVMSRSSLGVRVEALRF